MNVIRKSLVYEVIASLFILLFVYAALSKIMDFEKFRVELGKSPVLNAFSGIVAVVIPVIEIIISIYLATKRYQLIAFYAAFMLMVVFSAYIVDILNFSSYVPCSCGGVLQNMSWPQHLVFNIGFIILSIIAILIYPNQNQNLMRNKRES